MFARMRKSKIYKIVGGIVLVGILGAGITYASLNNRHQAIVKTEFLFRTGLVDSKWNVDNQDQKYSMLSPAFWIDDIYKSMEGPKATNFVQLTQDTSVIYISGFRVTALDNKTNQPISNDFICHTNVDFNDSRYYSSFGLQDRIGINFPRMTSLSNGQESFEFPKGYGVPMKGNDLLNVTTETLNHNIENPNFWVRHRVDIDYSKETNAFKPLLSRTVWVAIPFDKNDPYKEPLDPSANQCIPVETKNHTYEDGSGGKLSGHWVIHPGKSTWNGKINHQLQIKDSLRLHAAAVHVHPFATSLKLIDKTDNRVLFDSKVQNYKDKIGLKSVGAFSSESGIWMYKNHEYELQLDCDNTTNIDQDMMGSMFLFFYDAELEAKIKELQ